MFLQRCDALALWLSNMLSERQNALRGVPKRYSSELLHAGSQRFSCTCLASPGDGWCARWLCAPAPAWHAHAPSCSQHKPSKTPPTSYTVRTRPVKPPGKMICGVGDFCTRLVAAAGFWACSRPSAAVRGRWKVSDAEDNEVTCLRRRRRGARNRSGQACRQTEDSSPGRRCGDRAGAAATPSAVQCQPHHAIDATSQRLSTKRCHSHRQRAARRSSARRFG